MDKVTIVVQYFRDCPNARVMIENVKIAANSFPDAVAYQEVLVEDNEAAQSVGFRGSPTLLINNQDFDNLPVPEIPNLACRFYINGIPRPEDIAAKIDKILEYH